jgi:hypothetical protein
MVAWHGVGAFIEPNDAFAFTSLPALLLRLLLIFCRFIITSISIISPKYIDK